MGEGIDGFGGVWHVVTEGPASSSTSGTTTSTTTTTTTTTTPTTTHLHVPAVLLLSLPPRGDRGSRL